MKEINHTEGNDATLRAVLKRQGELFPVELSEEVKAEVVSRIGKRTTCSCAVSDVGTVLIDISGELPSGGYVIAVYGKLDGMRWRSACRGLHITKVTMPGVGNGIATDSDAYDIEMEVEMYKQPSSEAAIQRHNEDREAHADIRNLIPDNAVTDPFYVHTDNNYSDEDKDKLAGLVGLPVCEGVTAANFFRYGGDWDATFCSLRVRWNHDYELDMEDIMLGIDEDVQNGFELALFTDDSAVIASHRNELKVSFDLPLGTDAYAEDFAEMSVKICDDNGREIEELLMSDELKVEPGYHYTLLLSLENGRLILDHKRYKLPKV